MKKLFVKYLNAVCTPEEFAEITAWLSDQGHEEAVSKLIKENWEEHLREEIPGDEALTGIRGSELWSRISLAISRKERERMKRQLRVFRWSSAAAAVLAVALLAANLFFRESPAPMVGVAQVQTITVPNGARSNFLLPDGSEVRMNSGSTLTYASDFSRKRALQLEGEAYFEVVKGESPFTINTSLGQVEVTGTCLNVKSCAEEKRFETTVEKGSVNVYCPQFQDICRLEPGQQVRLDKGKYELLKVETDIYTSWKEGKIIFRKEYLPEVAKRLERWYNVKIVLDNDPRLTRIHYTGTLEMESFSEVMELLKLTASINYSYNDKTRVILITHR